MENALYAHDAVDEAIVVPVPDHVLVERVGAMVSLEARSCLSLNLCNSAGTRFDAMPARTFLVQTEALAHNASGKMRELRGVVAQEWERRKSGARAKL